MGYSISSLMTERTIGVRNIAQVIHLYKEYNLILYTERNVNKVHLQLSVATHMSPKIAHPLD